jgi:hypothetical protein
MMAEKVFVMLSGVGFGDLGTLDQITINVYGDLDFAKRVAELELEQHPLDWQSRSKGLYVQGTVTSYFIKEVTVDR